MSSQEANSDMSEQAALHGYENAGNEVMSVIEFMNISGNLDDISNTSVISIKVDEQPSTEEERDEKIVTEPGKGSFPERFNVGSLADVVSNTFERCRQNPEKIKEKKEDDKIIPFLDDGENCIAIREVCALSVSSECKKQSEELKCLDVIPSLTTGNRGEEYKTKGKARAEYEEEGETDNEFTPLLVSKEISTIVQEVQSSAPSKESAKEGEESNNQGILESSEVSQSTKDYGGTAERESESEKKTLLLDTKEIQIQIPETVPPHELCGQNALDPLQVILPTVSEIIYKKDSSTDLRHDGNAEDNLKDRKTENKHSKRNQENDEVKLIIDDDENFNAPLQFAKRDLPQSKNTEEQQETEGDAEQEVDFSVKDVLCFAWQIAKGMVGAKMRDIFDLLPVIRLLHQTYSRIIRNKIPSQ